MYVNKALLRINKNKNEKAQQRRTGTESTLAIALPLLGATAVSVQYIE
jgi:hypothetical protein